MIGKEPWYMSRRIWGALLMLVVATGVTFFPEFGNEFYSIAGVLASLLGIVSWTKPTMFKK